MKSIAYYNGQTGAPEELTVPFNDRSHYFGDGVYDATMGANGKVFLLEEHLDRFYSSAASFQINVPMDRDELGALLTTCSRRSTARRISCTGRSRAASAASASTCSTQTHLATSGRSSPPRTWATRSSR